MRAGSLPARSSRVMDLVTNAPSWDKSRKSAYSNAYPHVPEQVIVGFESLSPARLTERSITSGVLYAATHQTQEHLRHDRSPATAIAGLCVISKRTYNRVSQGDVRGI